MTTGSRHDLGDDAFSLYLQARSEWNRRTPSSIRKAIRYLEKAISLDGAAPLACAALADCYSILLDYGVISPKEGLTQARLASGRALHKGPDQVESLTSAALVRQMDLDWPAAETEFLAAIQAHPGYAIARQRYALFLAWMGRSDQARREIEVAGTLEPHSPAISASSAWIEYFGRDYPQAIHQARAVLDRHPGFASAQAVLASALVQAGEPDQAVEILGDVTVQNEENVSILALRAYALAQNGEPEPEEEILEKLRGWSGTRYVSPYYLAVGLMGAGRTKEALEELRGAETQRSPQLAYLLREPIFDPLRDHPEFVSLLARLRFPEEGVVSSLDPQVEVA
jgi:serine/threonine-protein kinase